MYFVRIYNSTVSELAVSHARVSRTMATASRLYRKHAGDSIVTVQVLAESKIPRAMRTRERACRSRVPEGGQHISKRT